MPPESSTGTDDDTVVVAQDVNSADSSDADAGVKEGFVEAIEAALKPEESPSSSENGETVSDQKTGEDEKAPSEDEDGDKPTDPDEDELKNYTENAQNRIRELIDRRKGVEAERDTLQTELDQVKPNAERMDRIDQYMAENRITGEHFNNVMTITALINRGEYDKALQIVKPIYDQLQNVSGEVLPAELQQDVDLGYITEDHARELHKSRTQNQNTQARTERDAADRQKREHENQIRDQVDMMAKEGDAWAAERKTTDPDWSMKQESVHNEIELEIGRAAREGRIPKTREEVRKLLDGALANVEKRLKAFQPRTKPTDIVTGDPASPASRAKPGSYMDAVDQALGDA
jgi:hypothetical protein